MFTKADHFCDMEESDAGLSADALASVSAHNVPEKEKFIEIDSFKNTHNVPEAKLVNSCQSFQKI